MQQCCAGAVHCIGSSDLSLVCLLRHACSAELLPRPERHSECIRRPWHVHRDYGQHVEAFEVRQGAVNRLLTPIATNCPDHAPEHKGPAVCAGVLRCE